MKVKACPEDNDLAAHLLGRLQGDLANQLDSHLESCDMCVERADQMKLKDELTTAIGSSQIDLSDEQSIQIEIARQAYTLKSISATTTGSEASAKRDDSVDESSIDIRFLSPAQEPDELGRLGHYRILEVLGVGGMGIVFRAEDTVLKRQVALKAMKPEIAATQSAKERFLREARATASIEHDNIVTIHQVGEEAGIPFLAMQYLQGESLRNRVNSIGVLPVSDVLRIGREAAAGLAAAHEQGLVHRDIKPDNIWLERSVKLGSDKNDCDTSALDRVKIVDFGLARADDDIEITKTGTVMGTPRYMSPEQAQGRTADHRSDLFSLGAVLYHLLTGNGPFDRSNMTATLLAVIHEEPDPIAGYRQDVPSKLVELTSRLLQKDPELRPSTADSVATSIASIESTIEPNTLEQSVHSVGNTGRWLMIGGALVFAFIAALGVVFLFPSSEGTLRVEVNDDNLQVLVDGSQITLTDKQWKGTRTARRHKLGVKLGDQVLNIGSSTTFQLDGEQREHRLKVQVDGVTLSSNTFEVVRGEDTVVEISLETTPEKPKQQEAEKLPERLADLATGTWMPLVSKADDLTKTLNLGGEWKDGALELVAPHGRVDGKVVFEFVRGRRVILRADVERVAGHTAGLAFEGENRSFTVQGAKNRNDFTLNEHEKGLVESLKFEPTEDSGTFGFHDLALVIFDGHAGVYVDGKLVLQRGGFKPWRWTPFASNFNWEGKAPAHARFRNIRVMKLDEASGD